MDKQAATRLIEDTFKHPFDKQRFDRFANELLNGIDRKPNRGSGQVIPDAFKEHISFYERIGTYTDPKRLELDVLMVRLKNDGALHRARTMQRNFVAQYLKQYAEREAALVAYYSDSQPDWRFSLVQMEYKAQQDAKTGRVKVFEELTPARRYSFLVGKNEPNHTAQQQLLPMLEEDRNNPTLERLHEAFNIESVTKEFFNRYKEHFLLLQEELESIIKKDTSIRSEFARCQINPAIFAKKLLGQMVFLYFLQKKGWLGVQQGAVWSSGPRDFLHQLFDGHYISYNNYFNDILEPLFYQALANERPNNFYTPLGCQIPFLNGGLFEPTGGYDWRGIDVLIDNDIFARIFETFNRYNFTVREDEPLEKEVAVDPEMLGKVFENLLDVSERKGKGAFYTPRESVHYMCQESLINYLDTTLNLREVPVANERPLQNPLFGELKPRQTPMTTTEYVPIVPREDIARLIRLDELSIEHEAAIEAGTKFYKAKLPQSVRTYARQIDDALANIKICDIAIGSGAFPVGMMHEIVRTREALTTHVKWGERSTYSLKRHAIQESIYGVDIDPSAVDIAKLRLWLSLVVDEDNYHSIKPLPNLDYKIICGNSLLKTEKTLFNNDLLHKLQESQTEYVTETNPAQKQQQRAAINQLIVQISGDLGSFDFEVYFSEVFEAKGGFDVVIGNPPYVSHDRIPGKEILKKGYECYEPFADLYCYFIECAFKLQNKTGLVCFITSNSYLRANYGLPLRQFIRKRSYLRQIINIEDSQVFDSAIVNVAILICSKSSIWAMSECTVVNSPYDGSQSFHDFVEVKSFKYHQSNFDTKSWTLARPTLLQIQNKIEKSGKTLEKLGAKIRLGIATGCNDAFVIDSTKRDELLKKNHKNIDLIKPVLRGRDIDRYSYHLSSSYILLTKNGVNVQRDYPDIYNHLNFFGDSFKNRGAKGAHWTNLRACAFFDDFRKEKIVWIELTDVGRFALSNEEVYLLNSAYFMLPPAKLNSRYLLGVLNSRLIRFYLNLIAETSGMGTSRWINNYVKEFPIPTNESQYRIAVISLVNQILTAKHANPAADVSTLEREIDQLVYALYGLTEEEIAIIEERNNP